MQSDYWQKKLGKILLLLCTLRDREYKWSISAGSDQIRVEQQQQSRSSAFTAVYMFAKVHLVEVLQCTTVVDFASSNLN